MFETVLAAFRRNAREAPERLAFVHGEAALTFAQLERRSAAIAAGLAAAGVAPGMPVGVLLSQPLRFPPALLALWQLGAIAVPFDPAAPKEDRAARENVVDLRFLVADGDVAALRSRVEVLSWHRLECENGPPSRDPAPGDECLIQFTSGTTGRPKGLLHSHASLWHMTRRNVELARSVVAGDVVLATIPLQLGLGMIDLLLSPLMVGATVVLAQPFSPRIAVQLALKWRATSMVTVPAVVKLLAEVPAALGTPAFRRVNVNSALLDEAAYEAFHARFGIRPVRAYGMSEIGRIASTSMREESAYRPIVGWPLVELRLLDDEGREVPPGEPGEVAVRAESLCRIECLVEGGGRERLPMRGDFFLTGDIGRLEPDGALALVGRKKAFINGPRLRVDPREVEAVLRRMHGVRDAVVVPSSGRSGYDAIHAFIVAEPTVGGAGVAAHCADHLPLGKRPQIIEFVESIPRDAAGKAQAWRLAGRGSTRP